jgi:ubiquinone biosynthesis protein
MNWHDLLDENKFSELLPHDYAQFAMPVCEGLAVFLSGLPPDRQAEILTQQAALIQTASFSERLSLLARNCPVLQKIGQILARDQRLPPELRHHLQQLESLPPSVPLESIELILRQELGPLDQLGIRLLPPALAEASVAVVIPFVHQRNGKQRDGVFKILKPGIEQRLDEELTLLGRVGVHLDERCEALQIPHLDYEDSFHHVSEKLRDEICLRDEQRHLGAARAFYANEKRVLIPEVFEELCTSRITAMERVWGCKVTDHQHIGTRASRRLSETIVDAMIAQPFFSTQNQAIVHCDPHAGNLLLTTDGRLAILDWSLVGWLEKQDRIAIVQLLLASVAQNPESMSEILCKLSTRSNPNRSQLRLITMHWLKKLRMGHFPGLRWLIGLLDDAVQDASLRLKPDLLLLRKSQFTLKGVVGEIGAKADVFDRVMLVELFKHFMREWPSRWFAPPNAHKFSTNLSNHDLMKAILDVPFAANRFWLAKGSDWWDNYLTSCASRFKNRLASDCKNYYPIMRPPSQLGTE